MSTFSESIHPLAQCLDDSTFAAQLSALICAELSNRTRSFADLICKLPSVYPGLVFKELKNLATTYPLARKLLNEATRSFISSKPPTLALGRVLPDPHPLDSEWRFSMSSVDKIVHEIHRLLPIGGTVVGLGMPSLMTNRLKRRFILIDSNPALSHARSKIAFRGELFSCNLLFDELPTCSADLVILDPPWYPSEMKAFLWAARNFCRNGARVLMFCPQVGTRPGMNTELGELLRWADRLKLHLTETYSDFVKYESPPFERLSLEQDGVLRYPFEWRKADLLSFCAHGSIPRVPRPNCMRNATWQEVQLGKLRIRVATEQRRAFEDPRLISLAQQDSPVSVSRRDPRKERAKVWTSGNRVFDCLGPNVFLWIARAFCYKVSPIAAVEMQLGRLLTKRERALTELATRQIQRIVKLETKSLIMRGASSPKLQPLALSLGDALPSVLRQLGIKGTPSVSVHLAVFLEPYLKYILDGSKTVESRFSQTRRAPFNQVAKGDLVFIKKSGGPIVGVFQVAQVWSYTLDSASWKEVKVQFAQALRAQDPAFWLNRAEAKFATLMRVCNVRAVQPVYVHKRDMRGWVVLKQRDHAPKNTCP